MRQVLGKGYGSRIEACRADLIIGQGRAGAGIDYGARDAFGLAAGAVQRAEIARERRGGGNISGAGGRILTKIRLLKSAEKEQLVANDPTSERTAELISLQAVLPWSEVVDCVRVAIAEELEQIAVPRIRSGLGDHVHYAAGMQPVPGRQRARFHTKFRQRVREGERHIHVGKAVIVVSAVQKVVGGVAGAARNRDRLRTEKALAAGVGSIAVINGSAGDGNQLCRVAAIERQVDDPLLIHYLGDRV